MDLDAILARQLQVSALLCAVADLFHVLIHIWQLSELTATWHVNKLQITRPSAQAEEQLQARQAGHQQQGSSSQTHPFASRLQICLQHSLSVCHACPDTLLSVAAAADL